MTKKPEDISEEYWQGLSADHQKLYGLVRMLPAPVYTVDWHIGSLERTLSGIQDDMAQANGTFELEPDFQRGHVWTDEQRVAYVEAVIRKTAPTRLLFNCPGWSRNSRPSGDIPDNTFQCIDGLQRLTSMRQFLAGKFTVFGGESVETLKGSPFDLGRYRLQMAVYEFNMRADLLQFYIDLNAGGTVHAQTEIDRVRSLIHDSKQACATE